MSKNTLSEAGAIHLLVPIVVLIAGSIFLSSRIQTNTKFPDNSNVQGVLIAKGDNSGSGNSNSDSQSSDRSEEHRKNDNFGPSNNVVTTQEDRGRGGPSEVNQHGPKVEIKNQEEASPSATSSNQVENRIRSIAKFPLRIDLENNQLIMIKGGEERILTILPEKAVQNMLRAHLKKGLGPKFFGAGGPSASPSATPEGSPSASPTTSPIATSSSEPAVTESSTDITVLESQIELEERDGKPVYKIPALKHLKLFGFIPTTTQFTDFVSAETGSLIEEQESLLARFLDLLSP